MKKKLTRYNLQEMKDLGQKAAWVTAYDYWTANFAETADVDMILVGDSLGMCVYGYDSTLPVTMDQCIYHSEGVRRGASNTFVIGDMPFLSYQTSSDEAIRNAGRFHKEAAVDAVKLEGGRRACSQIEAISDAGMLVMGHIGLTPQSSGQLGGFKAQGRTAESAHELIKDAKAVQEAGAFAILVEAVAAEVCKIIRDELTVPVYGIGAGIETDGQVLVVGDLLGIFQAFTPRFAKKYANLAKDTIEAFAAYVEDVRSGSFPEPRHTYYMVKEELPKLMEALEGAKESESDA